MQMRTARCHCDQLQVHCAGAPWRVSMCHCLDCQRRTGSAFSIAAFFTRAAVMLPQGPTRSFTRDAASGFTVTFYFCDACGSNLYWIAARMPHLIGVAVGAFGDPDFAAPEQAVWTRDQHAWLRLPDGMPCHVTNPPPRSDGTDVEK